MHDQVACDEDALLRQVHDRIAGGVTPPEMQDVHLSTAQVDRHLRFESDRRRRVDALGSGVERPAQ
jgi:hypothetical protein